jgi:hypothetical protein
MKQATEFALFTSVSDPDPELVPESDPVLHSKAARIQIRNQRRIQIQICTKSVRIRTLFAFKEQFFTNGTILLYLTVTQDFANIMGEASAYRLHPYSLKMLTNSTSTSSHILKNPTLDSRVGIFRSIKSHISGEILVLL